MSGWDEEEEVYLGTSNRTKARSGNSELLSAGKYTDNYMTDDIGQRWVKLQYAQHYADAASKAETERDHLMEEIFRLRALEDSYDTEQEVMAEIFLTLNKLCGT